MGINNISYEVDCMPASRGSSCDMVKYEFQAGIRKVAPKHEELQAPAVLYVLYLQRGHSFPLLFTSN